ncbi:MAG TPA: cyclopropane-fatty-acyl-phospholipid synthase family protein [Candidatus Acidoferrum sp.]|nr:cyclopropane-fatty-acyl-phospholipid synthase family protein [Candidatus Acidoferrum sp.]
MRLFQKQAKKLFLRALQDVRGGFLEIVCPDRTYAFGEANATLRAMAVVHDERFFVRAITGADIGIGESYMDGDWTTPDLVALVRLVVRNLRVIDSSNRFASIARMFLSRLRHGHRGNSISGSRENIRAHYDIGNDFYRLFLDERMNYSSAYFGDENESLDAAQVRKLDRTCQKLCLGPGDRVLEIGCGWGGFAIYAAQRYGARVTGLTISEAQYAFAADQVAAANLGNGSVKLLLQDYRTTSGQFDKIVSIEMFEAVGLDRYDEFLSTCDRLLTPNGSMLLQTITLPDQQLAGYRKRVDWIQTYIFPGSELAVLSEINRSLARATQLSMVQLESFGLHYAETLSRWRARFFQNLDRIRQLGYEERFQRMWDFYFGWCEGAFRERYVNVAQILLAKNGAQCGLLGDPTPGKALAARA